MPINFELEEKALYVLLFLSNGLLIQRCLKLKPHAICSRIRRKVEADVGVTTLRAEISHIATKNETKERYERSLLAR